MSSILNFLANKEVLIILSALAFILLIWAFLFIQEKYNHFKEKSKLKQNTEELKNLVEQVRLEEAKNPQPVVLTPAKEEIPLVEKKEEVTSKSVSSTSQDPASLEELIESIAPSEQVNLDSPMKEETTPSFTQTLEKQPAIPVVEKEKPVNASIDMPAVEMVVPTALDVSSSNVDVPIATQDETDKKVVQQTPIVEEKKEEKIEYKEEVYTKTEAQEELERLTRELAREEEDKIELTEFEAKQEENAIISLDELLAKGKALVLENEETQYMDEGNEPISIQDLEQRVKEQMVEEFAEEKIEEPIVEEVKESPKMQMDDFYTVSSTVQDVTVKPLEQAYQAEKKYTPSPVISPVFGLRSNGEKVHDESLQLENTANFEKLDEEIRKTNEFLAILKELQKKLD